MKNTVQSTRRDFLVGFSAFAAAFAGRSVFAGAALPDVPAYYTSFLAEILAKVNRHRMEDGCGAGFWFVTDLHILHNNRKSGALLAKLVSESPVKRVISGGDLPVAYGSAADLDRIARDLWPNLWVRPLQAAGARLYAAKGNHDFHISDKSLKVPHMGLQYSAVETAEILRACNGNASAVTDETNPAACYLYFDDPAEKVRYVIADTSDAPCEHGEKVGVPGGHVQMSVRQLKWLASRAFGTVPAGYSPVVVHHVPLATVVATRKISPSLEPFLRLLEAYQARSSVTLGGETFDFADRKGADIAFDLTGHHHSDRQSFVGGLLHVSESCDAKYRDYISRTPFSGNLPVKTAGTVYEQTFDCVQVNLEKGLLYVTRIGGGQDRVYHLKPQAVKAGGTLALSPETLKPTSWTSFDCDSCKVTEKARTPEVYWTFHRDHGTVDGAGTFTAAKPGPSMALAMDADLRKEFFPITVES